jgi:hypothetical protein
MADVAHLSLVEQYATAAIKKYVDFDWIRYWLFISLPTISKWHY